MRSAGSMGSVGDVGRTPGIQRCVVRAAAVGRRWFRGDGVKKGGSLVNKLQQLGRNPGTEPPILFCLSQGIIQL